MFAERDRVYVIAEIGSNHGGSLPAAFRLIEAAAAAGADAVKFQMFRAATMYPEGERREAARPWELDERWLPILAVEASNRGVDFLCSVFDGETAAAVDPFVKAHKIASLEMTWDSLLRNVAQRGKPMLVSTGAATLEQVRWALGVIRSVAPDLEVVLMHCVAAYPADLDQANLLAIIQMSAKHGVQVGWSDHTTDPVFLPAIAVALGAPVIEKHLRGYEKTSLNWAIIETSCKSSPVQDMSTPDAPHSMDPSEFAAMVDAIRLTERALGDGKKRVMPSEEPLRPLQRGPLGLRGA